MSERWSRSINRVMITLDIGIGALFIWVWLVLKNSPPPHISFFAGWIICSAMWRIDAELESRKR